MFISFLAILEYIEENITNNMNLCLSWLYEEYSVSQGFIKLPLVLKNNLSSEQNYNNVLCSLIKGTLNIEDPKEKEE